MRAGVTSIITFICCLLGLVTVMTIGSFNLQRDELERAIDFTAKQTLRQCAVSGVDDQEEIHLIATKAFGSQINSKKGTLTFYVLYADENIADVAATLTYTQYNGTTKMISCRKTYIKDWEFSKEQEAKYRFISSKYYDKSETEGGLLENSVWKDGSLDVSLSDILNNQLKKTGEWEICQYSKLFKQEID